MVKLVTRRRYAHHERSLWEKWYRFGEVRNTVLPALDFDFARSLTMKLYSYFRSSAAYRLDSTLKVSLMKLHQFIWWAAKWRLFKVKSQCLSANDGDLTLSQSLSILEYLDDQKPNYFQMMWKREPKSVPSNRLWYSPLKQLTRSEINDLNVSDEQKNYWYQHWMAFKVSNSNFKIQMDNFASSNDCRLLPDSTGLQRETIDLSAFPKIESIYQHCLSPSITRHQNNNQIGNSKRTWHLPLKKYITLHIVVRMDCWVV